MLKKKALWFTLYGILITVVFLYLLFPADIVKNRMENALNSSGFVLKTQDLRSSFPLGLKMKNVSLSPQFSTHAYVRTDLLDVQFNPISFFQQKKYLCMSGQAYGGNFSGRFGLASFSKIYPPEEGKLRIQDIDLGKYSFIKTLLGRDVTGRASGNWTFNKATDGYSSGTIDLILNQGTFALIEPFLGLSRIDFNRCEIKASIKNGRLMLEKMEILGPQLDCFFNGDVTLADNFKNSQLSLNGEMVIAEKKVKMKITIGGTLANPLIRYM